MAVTAVTVMKLPLEHYPLVKRFYKACRYPAKPGRDESVFVACREPPNTNAPGYAMVAALRLLPGPELHTEQWYCLRSVVTAPTARGQGIARQLLQHAFSAGGFASVYCYALVGTEALYSRVGFVKKSVEQAPLFVQEGYQRYRRQGRNICIMIRKSNEVVDV